MSTMPFSSVAVIGCGLIGGSVLKAIRATWPDVRLIACDPDAASRDYIQQHNLADMISAVPNAAGAQLVVLASPIPALAENAAVIGPGLEANILVTDVASVKLPAIAAIAPHMPNGVQYIPGHPIAGSEKKGVGAAQAELFAGKRVVLTPEQPDLPGVAEVAAFWRGLGADVLYMPPDLHDQMYAAVSHVPQFLAFIIKTLHEFAHVTPEHDITRRFFRLCDSDAALWSGIFEANKDNISRVLGLYLEALHQIIQELGSAQEEAAEVKPQPQVDAEAAIALFPYFAASCLVSAVAREERALGVKMRNYAGTGFADFTAPLVQDPEAVMERASTHAKALAALLEKFAAAI